DVGGEATPTSHPRTALGACRVAPCRPAAGRTASRLGLYAPRDGCAASVGDLHAWCGGSNRVSRYKSRDGAATFAPPHSDIFAGRLLCPLALFSLRSTAFLISSSSM